MGASPWIERIARFGYAAKGVVYFIVGLLAMQVAFGVGSNPTYRRGPLQTIVTQPFGKFLLGIVAVGLIAYVFWRFTQACVDPEYQGTDVKRVLHRLSYAISGLIYAGSAFTAVQIIIGSGDNSSKLMQVWTARLIEQPFGQLLVGIVGVYVFGVGLSYVYTACIPKFSKQFELTEMNNAQIKWATYVGRFGFAARGIAVGIIGLLLIQAALLSDPDEAQGMVGALQELAEEPFGQWLLGVVAFGLVAYAIYMLILARYYRIVTR